MNRHLVGMQADVADGGDVCHRQRQRARDRAPDAALRPRSVPGAASMPSAQLFAVPRTVLREMLSSNLATVLDPEDRMWVAAKPWLEQSRTGSTGDSFTAQLTGTLVVC